MAKVSGEPLVPRLRSLFETVQRTLQETDIVKMSGVDEARRLLAIDSLLQVTMKKGVLHIELVDRPAAGGGDAEDDTNGGRFDNRIERLVVVDVVALSEAADQLAGLVTGESAVGVEFMLINLLARHNIGTWR